MSNNPAIVSIVAIPRNQFRWRYILNEGKDHVIRKEDAFEYFKQFISTKNYIKLNNLLSSFLPFIILVEEDIVIQLKKEETDNEYYRKAIETEINSVLDKPKENLLGSEEHIKNDDIISRVTEKYLNR